MPRRGRITPMNTGASLMMAGCSTSGPSRLSPARSISPTPASPIAYEDKESPATVKGGAKGPNDEEQAV